MIISFHGRKGGQKNIQNKSGTHRTCSCRNHFAPKATIIDNEGTSFLITRHPTTLYDERDQVNDPIQLSPCRSNRHVIMVARHETRFVCVSNPHIHQNLCHVWCAYSAQPPNWSRVLCHVLMRSFHTTAKSVAYPCPWPGFRPGP